ncbi:Uncharacterised protein [Mycobacterium tuberculosis]|nr:Uncharacterised protein [Mycobacterium tuberculosis]
MQAEHDGHVHHEHYEAADCQVFHVLRAHEDAVQGEHVRGDGLAEGNDDGGDGEEERHLRVLRENPGAEEADERADQAGDDAVDEAHAEQPVFQLAHLRTFGFYVEVAFAEFLAE